MQRWVLPLLALAYIALVVALTVVMAGAFVDYWHGR